MVTDMLAWTGMDLGNCSTTFLWGLLVSGKGPESARLAIRQELAHRAKNER